MAERTCSIEGCDHGGKMRRGMCGLHYQRWKRNGTTDPVEREYIQCVGPKCDRRAGTSGMCPSHYKQWHTGKDLTPLRVATKDLGRPAFCVVPNCGRPHKARGLCKPHNEHMVKYGEIRRVRLVDPGRPCRIGGCDEVMAAHSLCVQHVHYLQTARRYGLDVEAYLDMQEARDGCDICGRPNYRGAMLAVDHDHACCAGTKSCGECIRGLLCDDCNRALGMMHDDIDALTRAAEYLARARRGVEVSG